MGAGGPMSGAKAMNCGQGMGRDWVAELEAP